MIKKPIILRAHNNDVQQYLDPAAQSSTSANLQFSTPVEESHPDAWDGELLIVPHNANLLVSVVVAALDNQGVRATKDIQILVNGAPRLNVAGVKETPVVEIVPVSEGDTLRIVWQVSVATSLSGNPIETHLSIIEIQ